MASQLIRIKSKELRMASKALNDLPSLPSPCYLSSSPTALHSLPCSLCSSHTGSFRFLEHPIKSPAQGLCTSYSLHRKHSSSRYFMVGSLSSCRSQPQRLYHTYAHSLFFPVFLFFVALSTIRHFIVSLCIFISCLFPPLEYNPMSFTHCYNL